MGAGAGRLVAAAPRRAAGPRPFGPGEWLLDDAPGDPDPTPVTTIAWRLGHLHLDFAGAGSGPSADGRQPEQLVDFSPSAAVALERSGRRWTAASVAAVTGEQLDTVGYSQYPWSDAAELPFITVIWAGNIEFIHHMAEIALLRDLYRTRSTGSTAVVGWHPPTHRAAGAGTAHAASRRAGVIPRAGRSG